MVIKYGWSESEGLTEMNREGETWKIGCEDELEHYPLKHYLQRLAISYFKTNSVNEFCSGQVHNSSRNSGQLLTSIPHLSIII